MAVINQPKNLLPSPFCDMGDKNIVPGSGGDTEGLASYASGFPPVTQKPPSAGGIAPQRMDFNGIFFMLSAFTFWQQSGGLMAWTAELNYSQPNLVYHNNVLWWCVKDSGPGTPTGAKEPSKANEAYWLNLLDALANMASGGSGSASGLFGSPVGTYILFHGTTAPDGYFACDGSTFSATKYPKLYQVLGSTILPDVQGLVARGYDPAGKVDPEGATRSIGSKQTDAGRNVTGSVTAQNNSGSDGGDNGLSDSQLCEDVGAMYSIYGRHKWTDDCNWITSLQGIGIDASRVWGAAHTSTEFRPANFCALWCIKHD